MSAISKISVVVVFEQELIEAAKSLEPFAKKEGRKPTIEDATNAIRACYAALYSPELASGRCPVTVIRKHDLGK